MEIPSVITASLTAQKSTCIAQTIPQEPERLTHKTPFLDQNQTITDWPSTTYVSGTFYMFVEDYTGGTLERWSSTDGIHYTFVENVKSGGNQYKNPFIWLNPNDNNWYLYSHDSYGSTEYLEVRSADSFSGLRTASDTVVASNNGPLGSPSMMYYNGKYWLLGEILPASKWQIVAYYSSTSPDSGFIQAANSPILTNDEACPCFSLCQGNRKLTFMKPTTAQYGMNTPAKLT